MNTHMYDDYLQHYGVLGMKWGVRKANKTGVIRPFKPMDIPREEFRAGKNVEKFN